MRFPGNNQKQLINVDQGQNKLDCSMELKHWIGDQIEQSIQIHQERNTTSPNAPFQWDVHHSDDSLSVSPTSGYQMMSPKSKSPRPVPYLTSTRVSNQALPDRESYILPRSGNELKSLIHSILSGVTANQNDSRKHQDSPEVDDTSNDNIEVHGVDGYTNATQDSLYSVQNEGHSPSPLIPRSRTAQCASKYGVQRVSSSPPGNYCDDVIDQRKR